MSISVGAAEWVLEFLLLFTDKTPVSIDMMFDSFKRHI